MATTPRFGQTGADGQTSPYRLNQTDKPDPTDASVYTGRTPGLAQTSVDNSEYVPYGGEYEDDGYNLAGTVARDPLTKGGRTYQRPVYPEPPTPLPVGYYIESAVYPTYYEEQLAIDASFLSGRINFSPQTTEQLELDAMFTSGVVVTYTIETYSMVAEAMNLDAMFTSGVVVTYTIETYSVPAEGFNMDAMFTSGNMVTYTIVTYSNWPAEGLNMGATLTGGALA